MIFSIILLVLLFLSVLVIIGQFVTQALPFNHSLTTGTRDIGPRLEECVLKDNDAHSKIAVVPVEGIITESDLDGQGNSMVDVIKAELDRANDDKNVRAVILKVNSPGGEVMASDEINKAIADFQNKSDKPVICSMSSLAASGGYYVSVPSRWIVANELTITGSIGVILHSWNYRDLMDKVGLAPVTYKSGKFKDMLDGERSTNEIPPEEHAMVQGLIDETFQKFKDVVREGREQAHEQNKQEGKSLASDWEDYADGRVLSGRQALGLGFVDELGDFDKAVARAKTIAHIHNANLIEYRERYDISEFLHLFGQSGSAHDVKLDLGVDMPKLQAGQLYFLYLPMSQ
jgi:protease-4